MYGISPGDVESSNLALEQLLDIQISLFDGLGLNYWVLDMPAYELGNPAYRKFDIEALLPGRSFSTGAAGNTSTYDETSKDNSKYEWYGEISSCSNCTDYQARRLNIRDSETGQFCHTFNGTACAVPRMIMAICEQNQMENGSIKIPPKLQKYMRQKEYVEPRKANKEIVSPSFRYMPSPNYFVNRLNERYLTESKLQTESR